MNPPDWATHEVVFDRGRGECRVWVSDQGYGYSKSDGVEGYEGFTNHTWGVAGWVGAIEGVKSYKLISAYPVDISLENK